MLNPHMCTCWWIFFKKRESQGSVEVQVSGKCLDCADVTVTGLHRIRVSISASTGANLLFRLRPTHICVHSRLQFSLSSVSLLPEGQSSVTLTSDATRRDCCFLNFFQAQHELWTIILTRWEPVELTREGPWPIPGVLIFSFTNADMHAFYVRL